MRRSLILCVDSLDILEILDIEAELLPCLSSSFSLIEDDKLRLRGKERDFRPFVKLKLNVGWVGCGPKNMEYHRPLPRAMDVVGYKL